MANRPSQDGRILSHGRGGAGNIAKNDPTASQPAPEDLVTPTLKGNTYTTGRGGTGNMAVNDPDRPEVARAAQDVDAPNVASEPKGPTHYGRGGAANIIGDKNGARKSEEVKREEGAAKGGLLAKGKELLNKLGGKK
ncbi:hypothetical protein FB567DRAFT_552790 [Paraphoma chrysanthemicola]|uniref:Uncharacterized protein n=1 Tax=Paraphoma chrysanthemicola TaxID=798071 RepID=A0A8K0QY16_9PLEO|nr:hypothetical protein FB567DRAFT_552790 [Paraphoma chrysanthemicola]